MSEVNVKLIFDLAGTIVGNVTEDLNGNVTIENPAFVIPTEEGMNLIPALQAMGVHHEETTMSFKKSEIKYGQLYRPVDGIAKEYKEQFGYVSLELPDTKLIL